MSQEPPDSIKRFLKKDIPPPSTAPNEAQEFLRKKLLEPKESQVVRRSFEEKMRFRWLYLKDRILFYKTRQFRKFMNESFPMIAFIGFSVYVVYKMEARFSEMRDKIIVKKSLNQLEIDRENEEIQQALYSEDEDLKPTRITAPKRKQKYKYEMIDDGNEEGSDSFSTKNDLLKEMKKDLNAGKAIPQNYKIDLENYIKSTKK